MVGIYVYVCVLVKCETLNNCDIVFLDGSCTKHSFYSLSMVISTRFQIRMIMIYDFSIIIKTVYYNICSFVLYFQLKVKVHQSKFSNSKI